MFVVVAAEVVRVVAAAAAAVVAVAAEEDGDDAMGVRTPAISREACTECHSTPEATRLLHMCKHRFHHKQQRQPPSLLKNYHTTTMDWGGCGGWVIVTDIV